MKTMQEAREFIAARSAPLDPRSRYIPELLAFLDGVTDVVELERRIDAGCRGRLHAGEASWGRMSLAEKLAANLVTNETELMRFDPAELAHLRGQVLPWLRGTAGRVASIPCSHGDESVSLAIEMLEAGLPRFHVDGFDIQRACVETARLGRIPVASLPRYVTAHVDPVVMEHLSFDVLDVLEQPIADRYDLVLSRNFLGYFRPEIGRRVVDKLVGALDRPGCLLVDPFIIGKHPELFVGLRRDGDLPFFWV